MKGTLSSIIRPIQRIKNGNRSTNTVCYLDTTHKLIKYELIASRMKDGFSRKIMWLKCYNDNRVETLCELFLHASRKSVVPLQVRSDIVSEN